MCSKPSDLHPSTQRFPAALHWLHKTSAYEYLTSNSCNANSSCGPSTPTTTSKPIILQVLQMLRLGWLVTSTGLK